MKNAEGNIYIDLSGLVFQKQYAVFTGKRICILYERNDVLCTGMFKELRNFLCGKQEQCVNIRRVTWFAQETNRDSSDDHAAIVIPVGQPLQGLDGRAKRLETLIEFHALSLFLPSAGILLSPRHRRLASCLLQSQSG